MGEENDYPAPMIHPSLSFTYIVVVYGLVLTCPGTRCRIQVDPVMGLSIRRCLIPRPPVELG